MQDYHINEEGYLWDAATWKLDFAYQLANNWRLSLSNQHIEIISALRNFYFEFNHIPPLRIFIKYLKQQNIEISSMQLQLLFPDPFMRHACQLAGLPKPVKCL